MSGHDYQEVFGVLKGTAMRNLYKGNLVIQKDVEDPHTFLRCLTCGHETP